MAIRKQDAAAGEPDTTIADRVLIETGPQDVRVLRTRLRNLEDLSIMDDEDLGGDPYNSTGQYVTLGSRDR